MKVLIIEDDIQLNTTVSDFLRDNGYEVTSLYDGEDGINEIDLIEYNLYIIDINIPNINGLDIVKYIRQKDLFSPIIMITASMELENIKTAFGSGCSEYIKKPFYLEELEIRINNILKKQNEAPIIRISDTINYDTEYEELKIDGEVVKLRKKERRLLTLFLLNINKTVTFEKIENYVWENEIKEQYPLRQLIFDLRKKFNTGENFIFNINGLGYRFETKI
ncbi:Response regulator receiver protein [Desulfamplus magnetovallimortis]|uniref:Response regulator receiver protein n=1 Tax=Desulfamplus magnetovallimortis TaxID=1246637 RepID=A0A1W1HA50_9BACT|nr:response regulator transcription factor [Desulfamplus magnetovallimortis]SLM29374.1 Response regulator receiver protein [Desulfamplus magnetovallimortis]